MCNYIKLQGSKPQIIAQLMNYMTKIDAERFFVKYFYQENTNASCSFTQPSTYPSARSRIYSRFPSTNNLIYFRGKSIGRHGCSKISTKKHKSIKKLTFSEIEKTSFAIGDNKKKHLKIFTKLAFVAAAVALDIALYCTINFSIIGTSISIITALFAPLEKKESSIAICIYSIVKEQGFLPQYSFFKKSNCKNYNLDCDLNNGKCGITKKIFTKVINKLVKQNVLIMN